MPNLAEKLHYQMLRKTYSGTSDEALELLIAKTGDDTVKNGEPVAIFYSGGTDTENGGGAMLAVKSQNGSGKSYVFYNAEQLDERFEEDELVTSEALLDLDDRISGLTEDVYNQFKNINKSLSSLTTTATITEDVKAVGTSAGAIDEGDTVTSGTSLTDFVKQLLVKEVDCTPHKPTAKLTTTAEELTDNTTIEVGETIKTTLGLSYGDGTFSGTKDGTIYAGCASGSTITYNMNSESREAAVDFTTTAATDYKFTASVPYDASTVTPTKNTGAASTQSIAAGTATTSNSITIKARYKYYIGNTTIGSTDADNTLPASTLIPLIDMASSGNCSNVITGWTNTVTDTVVKKAGENWKSNGKSIFVFITTSDFTAYDSTFVETSYRGNFNATAVAKTLNIGGTSTYSYNGFIWPVATGAAPGLTKITIKI